LAIAVTTSVVIGVEVMAGAGVAGVEVVWGVAVFAWVGD